jgi:DNA-binding beta-propeller fold protein YncE
MAYTYVLVVVISLLGSSIPGYATQSAPAALTVEDKIPLGDVRGRIDHLAVDVARHRLYVAELGNDSLGVVDLQLGKTTQTVKGLREPQGVGYVPTTDSVYSRLRSESDGPVPNAICRISVNIPWMNWDMSSLCFDTRHESAFSRARRELC